MVYKIVENGFITYQNHDKKKVEKFFMYTKSLEEKLNGKLSVVVKKKFEFGILSHKNKLKKVIKISWR